MEQFLIAHDLGTSGDKATLFTTEGRQVRSYTASYDVHFFHGNYAEQDPENWWDAVCEATKAVLEGEDASRVAAMSFSAQMQGCLPVDKHGRPLRDSMIWADMRAVKEAKQLEDAIGADRIATAHHAQDQAETVLLNLLRGTGPEGLGGIPPVRGRIVRPLLQTGRAEIEDYLQENGLSHVEDSTNEDTHYARNRLRRELWPRLETINPALTKAIGRTAEILRRENGYLDTLAAEYLPPSGTAVETARLLSAPEALRSRVMRLLLERTPTGKKDVGAAHIQALLALAESGGLLALPGGLRAVCRDGWLRLTIRQEPPPEMTLRQGVNRWGDFDITLRGGESRRVSVRTWSSADRMTVGRGSRSLKRLFSDAGIPPERRDTAPVVCVDGAPYAVYGVGERVSPENGESIEIIINKRENHKEDTGNG